MIELDGSLHSGSGTLLRYAAALSTLLHAPLHMTRIRAKRDKPGLRPQHLQALRACCSLSKGHLEGDQVNSTEVIYRPGDNLSGGSFHWDIGTAGSTTMLAFTLIPLAFFSKTPCRFSLTGGLFQDFAPSAFHMQKVLLPLIQRMGGKIRLEIRRPGYVPKGQGRLIMTVKPITTSLKPLSLMKQGNLKEIRGIALSSHLKDAKVSSRMATRCQSRLMEYGYRNQIDVLYDSSALQKGAALLLWAETDAGCILGADQAGRLGRRAEAIADFVISSLMEDLHSGATTDRHLADQLILFAALAKGTTQYRIPKMSDHIEANLWLVKKFLGTKTHVRGKNLTVEGIGLQSFKR